MNESRHQAVHRLSPMLLPKLKISLKEKKRVFVLAASQPTVVVDSNRSCRGRGLASGVCSTKTESSKRHGNQSSHNIALQDDVCSAASPLHSRT